MLERNECRRRLPRRGRSARATIASGRQGSNSVPLGPRNARPRRDQDIETRHSELMIRMTLWSYATLTDVTSSREIAQAKGSGTVRDLKGLTVSRTDELTVMSGRVTYARARNGEDGVELDDKAHLGNCGSALDLGPLSTGLALCSGFERLSDSGRRR